MNRVSRHGDRKTGPRSNRAGRRLRTAPVPWLDTQRTPATPHRTLDPASADSTAPDQRRRSDNCGGYGPKSHAPAWHRSFFVVTVSWGFSSIMTKSGQRGVCDNPLPEGKARAVEVKSCREAV